MEEKEIIEEENGKTLGQILGQICKYIWSKKIVGLIVWASVTIVLFFGTMFIINPMLASYDIQFQYTNCAFAEGTYSDGSKFDYTDLVSRAVVDDVISKNDNLKTVDVENIYKSNDFNIYLNYVYRDAAIKDYTIVSTSYMISVPYSCFDNEAQAVEFLKGLIEYPFEKEKEIITKLKFDNNFKLYENSTIYDSQISYLDSQINILNKGYDEWITTYGDVNVEYNNEIHKLSEFKNEMNQYLTEQHYSSMGNDLYLYGYVKDSSMKSEYEKQLAALKLAHTYLNGYESTTEGTKVRTDNSLDNLLAQQAELNASFSGGGTVSILQTEAYTNLINKVADVNAEILANDKAQDDLQRKITFIDSADKSSAIAFGNKLDSIEAKIKEYTNAYTEINSLLKSRNMDIFYSYSNIIKETGSFKTIVVIIGSIGLGLISGIVVAWIAGWAKSKKNSTEEKKETPVSE